MKSFITKSYSSQPVGETAVHLFDDWFDPIEAGVRDRVRGFIQAMIEGELDETLMRPRYGRRLASSSCKDDGLAAIIGRPSLTVIDGELWADRDRGAAVAACWRGRQDHRLLPVCADEGTPESEEGRYTMEEQGIADLSAPYAGCRCLDSVGLLGGHKYAPCSPCAQGTVC